MRALLVSALFAFVILSRFALYVRSRRGRLGAADDAREFAIVSYALPPTWSGAAIVLGRILSRVPARNYCLISRIDYRQQSGDEFIPRLPATYHHIPGDMYLPISEGFLRAWMLVLSKIGTRALRIAEIISAERVRTVVATTGDIVEVAASFVAARITGSRFVL